MLTFEGQPFLGVDAIVKKLMVRFVLNSLSSLFPFMFRIWITVPA